MNVSRLGARQIEVLRAAKAGKLVRLDSGTWLNGSYACTPAAKSVAPRGLLADGKRMVLNVLGGSSRPGCYVGLSSLGEVLVEAWERAHPDVLAAEERRADMIRRIAAKPGPVTGDDILGLAIEEGATDETFIILSQALDGREIGGDDL